MSSAADDAIPLLVLPESYIISLNCLSRSLVDQGYKAVICRSKILVVDPNFFFSGLQIKIDVLLPVILDW